MKTLSTLTINKAKTIIGKKISWQAPAASANANYKGVSIILEVDETNRTPLKTKEISGDGLKFAFNEWKQGGHFDEPLSFSDGDRYITYVIEE